MLDEQFREMAEHYASINLERGTTEWKHCVNAFLQGVYAGYEEGWYDHLEGKESKL